MTDNTQPVVQQDVEVPGIDIPNELLTPAENMNSPEVVQEAKVEKEKVVKEPIPKSPYKGVSYTRATKKWSAKALSNPDENGKRKLLHVGYFQDDKEAALARDKYIVENNLKCRRQQFED